MKNNNWPIVSSKLIFKKNRYAVVEERKIKLPGGEVRDFYLHQSQNVIMVVGFTKNKKLLLIKEYFPAHSKFLLSAVGGIVEQGEKSALAAAKREFLEETGYAAKKWVRLGYSYRGKYIANKIYHFLALNVYKKQEQNLEPGEAGTEVRFISIKDANNKIKNNKFEDMFGEVCLARALNYLREKKFI